MMQSPVPATAKETLRAIRVFFYTLIAGLSMFSIIVFALNFLHEPSITGKAETDTFLIAVMIIAAGCMIVAHRIYNKRINEIQNSDMKLTGKLEAYREALILFMAFSEGGGIFAVIVYYLTASQWLLIVIGVVILSMLLKRPEKSKIFNELQLSSEEQAELN
jgi:hypothetical protein